MTILHKGRLAFVYSTHRHPMSAIAAVDDYFANGEVTEPEFADIVKRGRRWLVLFWAE